MRPKVLQTRIRRRRRRKVRMKEIVNMQHKATLIEMLKAMNINHNGNIVILRQNLQVATIPQMRKTIQGLNSIPNGRKKEDIFRCLRQILLPKAVDVSPLTEVILEAASAEPVDVSPLTEVVEEAASAKKEKCAGTKETG